MRFLMRTVSCILLVILSALPLCAASTSGADFLKVDTGAFAAAAGGAFTAVLQGVNSLRYNPAGLAWQSKKELLFTVKPWIGDTLFLSVSYIEPVNSKKGIAMGLDLTVFSSLSIEQIGIGGESMGSDALTDLAGSFFLSYKLPMEGLSIGGGVRFIFRDVMDYYVYGIALDLSVLYRTTFLSFSSSRHKNFSIAVTLRNLGPDLNYSDSTVGDWSSHLPTSLNIGICYEFFNHRNRKLWLAADMSSYLFEDGTRYRIGIVYQPFRVLSLRFGYQSGTELQAFSFGTGIMVPTRKGGIRVDYAFLPLTNGLDPVHTMGITFIF